MPQYFPPNANAFAKWVIWGGAIFMIALVSALMFYARTNQNRVGVPVAQPVDFPHNLHIAQLGLDCRYCHNTVETAATASIPPTETCMTCHSQLRVNTPQLQAVTQSWADQTPIEWNRVHDMPDFVYFNHSAHVNNGVGCSTCHGRVDEMQGMWKNTAMTMGWCLECHKAPQNFLRPKSEVFNMAYAAPSDQLELGTQLVEAYHIDTAKLPTCSTCHR